MVTAVVVPGLTLLPIAVVAALMLFADRLQRRREAAVACQIALSDAIGGELGAIVAPTVRAPLWGPWRVAIAVPLARPATVGRILSIAHRVLASPDWPRVRRFELVLTPQEEPSRPLLNAVLVGRRTRAA
jgi:hypothetical protein